MPHEYYERISRAADLKDPKERFFYRLLEIFPGALSLGTFLGLLFLSWRFPVAAALLILAFVLYWVFKTIYLLFHLASGYNIMRKHEKMNWLSRAQQFRDFHSISHLILIPTFREPLEVLEQTLGAIANANYPKDRMIVVLGTEESEKENAAQNIALLKERFGSTFLKFLVTYHPSSIAGEIRGKGSNETWAAKEAREKILLPLAIKDEDVVVSSFDADTVVFPEYFACLTYYFLSSKDSLHTSFQPVPLFLNNIWQAPAISQICSFSSTFWHTMNQGRPEKLITFSSHAMSLKALVEVGFKQTNVVADDSHIFWQCFLHYHGEYRVQPLHYPLSMDANVGRTFWQTLLQMYKQQRRWAYGVTEIPYFLFGFFKDKKIALSKKISLSLELIEGHWSWATAPILLFGAGWLPFLLGGERFSHLLISYNLPRFTSQLLTLAMVGLITSVILSINLLPPHKPEYGKRNIIAFVVQWLLFPFLTIFFTSLPALDAQVRLLLGKYMGFWPTPKHRNPKSKIQNPELL